VRPIAALKRTALACICLSLLGAASPMPAARAADAPTLAARAAVVIEADTDATIYSRRAQERLPIASTTKLMTAYVALAHATPGRVLTVQPYTPAPEETVAGLVPGQRLTVADLLKAMLLPSGGDAAHTLAVDLGGGSLARFVGWMNTAAGRLHMRDTHYSTPVGLDTPGNYSTAADLAQLARALLQNPVFAQIVALPSARLTDGQVVVNRNDLVGRFPYVVGVKTGHTADAGYCLVGAARRDGATIISVVLGDPSEATRDSDTLALLRHGLSLYRRSEPVQAGHLYARVPGPGGRALSIPLVAADSVSLIVRRGAPLSVYLSGVAQRIPGPLAAGTKLGEILVRQAGHVLARVALVNADAVPPPVTPPAGPPVPVPAPGPVPTPAPAPAGTQAGR
jgi:D-alanyl-D-alanine carboxypeptidase (penicillin-binding protein 5/6)